MSAADAAAGERAAPSRPWAALKQLPLRQLLLALPLPVVLVVLWHVSVQRGWVLPLDIRMSNVPEPLAVMRRLYDVAFGGLIGDVYSASLPSHLWASTSRVLVGFALATLVAVPLGTVMGRYRGVSSMVDPTLSLARPIPVTAWVPLALIAIGIGDRATIFLVFLAAFFPILLSTVGGVRSVSSRLLEAAAMLGTRPSRTLTRVVVPAALPSILSGMRIALGFGWVVVVVGETVGIRTGLGAMIIEAQETSKTDLIVAGMVLIGLAGFATDRAMVALIRVSLRHRPLL